MVAPASRRIAMGATAAERKAAERLNRQVAPWRYRAELGCIPDLCDFLR